MSVFSIRRRHGKASALRGLPLALAIVTGCGRHAAPAAAPPTATPPKAASATVANSAAATPAGTNNPVNIYASVFEELPPAKGKDPFYPYSHRRDPKIVAPVKTGAPVAPELVLKGFIGGGEQSQVVINNQIFAVNDEREVRVPNSDTPIKVKCLDIGTDDVLIQVEGEAAPERLKMEAKKALSPYGSDTSTNKTETDH